MALSRAAPVLTSSAPERLVGERLLLQHATPGSSNSERCLRAKWVNARRDVSSSKGARRGDTRCMAARHFNPILLRFPKSRFGFGARGNDH